MSAFAFDTHRIVKQLQSVGFTEEQAEVVTSVVQMSAVHDLSHFATREQVATLGTELGGRISALEDRVTGLETKVTALDTKVTGLETKVTALDTKVTGLDVRVAALDTKFDQVAGRLEERIERRGAESDSRMMRWVVGTGVAAVLSIGGIVVGAVAFLLKALPLALH